MLTTLRIGGHQAAICLAAHQYAGCESEMTLLEAKGSGIVGPVVHSATLEWFEKAHTLSSLLGAARLPIPRPGYPKRQFDLP
jgi:hypothetical protein